ncbi:MAG: nitronate monooxygenase [Bacteroidetes bacterium]|nr:nitronate monooxygenase [Bacteroidota bacterium]MBU1580624.1 nitronate monooxygenase [Bacteroidota bacterium]MBU2465602.1 nitronate monooxygenase [Bacteroidota bacterium]MBU2558188.1 nitronate monooxygenase [Bacteroidota bacterium]
MINSLFGIKYPIIQAGMIWCSGWKLASAVSNSGGLGLIGAGSMYPEVLEEHIRKCKAATNKPFGVNVPLLYPQTDELIQIILREDVPVVFTSAGNPAKYTQLLKSHGRMVVHVIANQKFARKAEEAGVDAIVAEGFEAGGHNGSEETTTFTLIPLIKETVNIPVIAAGGIATGRQMLAAFALGADGVQIGSRFAASEESSAHQAFKQAILEAGDGATDLTMKQLVPVRLLKNSFYKKVKSAELAGADREVLKEILGRARAKKGMFEGELEEGELEIGQVAALIHEVKSAAEIMQEIIEDYAKAKDEINYLSIG